ncbi:NAD(P)H-binding protein [Pedococcus bigeumensis]|uniref:NAD-dependent epimerase/dehydratase family protein n=1 Tax=Pedococcus bigeumensis TaxID=433644 RepID=A0A502CMD8_9MICO|nr:NAD(P)H-binding protein [Pedococcus bigeumensis]TPG13299.1 NAD-dependent epimerase/dehydratase family protein [Pedococcus bigeumensis]
MRVVVMGAGGYVGSRLVPALLAAGHEVTATFTDATTAGRFWWAGQADVVEMDVRERASVRAATDGASALYYLVHGLGGVDFATSDRQGAYNAAHAAVRAGVERIIYLGGLVPDIADTDLSPHLRSRLEVEEVLTDSGVPTLALRAAMVIGSGSTSFEIMRQMSERMPVQVLPTWMDSQVEPVAVTDVITALVGALTAPLLSRAFDVGSGERMAYAALLRLYADRAGLRRVQVSVPGLPTALVSRLAPILTQAPAATVQTLVESLRHDMICGRQDFMVQLMPRRHVLTPVAEALDRALALPDETVPDSQRDVIGPLTSDVPWAGGQVSRRNGMPVHRGDGWRGLLLGPAPDPGAPAAL